MKMQNSKAKFPQGEGEIVSIDLKGDVKGAEKMKVTTEDEKALKDLTEILSKDPEARKNLKNSLEDGVQKVMGNVPLDKIEELLHSDVLSPEQKEDLMFAIESYSTKTELERQKKEELKKVFRQTRFDLKQLNNEVYYASKLTLDSNNSVESISQSVDSQIISAEDFQKIHSLLDGKGVLEARLTREERRIKSDFMNMLKILGQKMSLKDALQMLRSNVSEKKANLDWKQILNGQELTQRQIKTLTEGYDAYISSKDVKGPENWKLVLGNFESRILVDGISLDTTYQASLYPPVSKKERRAALRVAENEFYQEFVANEPVGGVKGSESWSVDQKIQYRMNSYYSENEGYLRSMKQGWLQQGFSAEQANKNLHDYIVEQFDKHMNKKWKEKLKEYEKFGIQKSDIGKFREIVSRLDGKSSQEKLLALMTDTDFDGIRGHLDVKGVKGALQVDQLFHSLSASGMKADDIAKNIAEYMELRIPGFSAEGKKTLDGLSKWMEADIKNALEVQNAVMDSPANAGDIMKFGSKALENTLKDIESFDDAVLKETKKKIEKEFPNLDAQAREQLMSSLVPVIQQQALALGVSIPMVIKGLNLNVAASVDNVGVMLSRDTSIAKWETGNVNFGLKAGTNLGFIPIYGVRAGIEQELNADELAQRIDPTAQEIMQVGANVTMLGTIPSYGISVGFEKNQIKGIEKQYKDLKKGGKDLMSDLLKTDVSEVAIREYLIKKYPKSDQATLDQATNNLLGVLQTAKGVDISQDQLAQVLADWYAESWRNSAIQGLSGKRDLSGASIGIQFLAGFYPIGTLALTLTKYTNKSFDDTEQSKQLLRQAEVAGIGNETTEGVKKSDFESINNRLGALLVDGEGIEMTNDGAVFVPKDLLNKPGIQVMIHDSLKGYVKETPNGKNIVLPAYIDWRLLSSNNAHGNSFILNVGGKTNDNMQILTNKNIKEYLGEKDLILEQQKKQITNALKAMQNKYPNELNDISISFENDQIKFIKGGEDTGPYEIGQPIDAKFDIKDGGVFYIKSYNGGTEIERRGSAHEFISFVYENNDLPLSSLDLQSKNNLLESLRAPNSKLVQSLSKLDDNKLTLLDGFLSNTKPEKADYEEAIKQLSKIIPNQDPYKELYQFLNTKYFGNGTFQETDNKIINISNQIVNSAGAARYLIVDRIKAIFATERGIRDVNSMRSIVNARNNAYQMLKGPDGKTMKDIGLNIDSREFAKTIPSTNLELNPNLVGFTAFYRRGTSEGRGFSLTGIGETNVLGGRMDKLTGSQGEAAKNWFLSNLEKYESQKQHLYKQIRETVGVNNLETEKVQKLLDGETIDIGNKMVKLDSEFVFYLMGECANESIGLNIKGVRVMDKVTGEVIDEGSMTFNDYESTVRANVDQRNLTIGVAIGGEEKNTGKKTQGGEGQKTQGGDKGEEKGGVDNEGDVGDHTDGTIPTGDGTSEANPLEINDEGTGTNGKSKDNPLGL